MTTLRLVPGGRTVATPVDVFEVAYSMLDGEEHRIELSRAWDVRFESGTPVRRFKSYKGQRHYPGRWWSATMGGHVGYESWLERDHLMLLDHDPAVTGIASQPFWLFWTAEAGKTLSHAPDYFARRANGPAVVVDCRPLDRVKPRDAAKFAATERACTLVGWEYRLVGAPDPVLVGNVRWLAGYRHPRHRLLEITAWLREAFATETPLMTGAESVGDPITVLPVLFHLLWWQELVTDLSIPLHESALVTAVNR